MKTSIVLAMRASRKNNDALKAHAEELARHISKNVSKRVEVGFEEPFRPSLQSAFDLLIEDGAARILVITPVLTRGERWAEEDVAAQIRLAQANHPAVEFAYAWPFSPSRVAKFLSSQLRSYL